MNVFGGRFSTPEYAAYFCSYQMPTIVVELRDTLLNSSDNFGSILRGALVNFRPFSKPLRSSADNSLEEGFMTHLSLRDEPELTGDLLLSK